LSTCFERHKGFRKADESLCADDGTEGDGTYIALLLNLAYSSVLLLTLLLITELNEGDAGFQHLTEEEIATDVVKASAMEEGSDNELGELQESTIKKKLLSSAREGIDAIINYVGSSSTN
jgi:hypothetical protein